MQLSKMCDSQNVQFCLNTAYFKLKHSIRIYLQVKYGKYPILSLASYTASLYTCIVFSSKFTETHNKQVLVRIMCEPKLISYVLLRFTWICSNSQERDIIGKNVNS